MAYLLTVFKDALVLLLAYSLSSPAQIQGDRFTLRQGSWRTLNITLFESEMGGSTPLPEAVPWGAQTVSDA